MIGIQLNKKDFEYDVYSLTRAFYPSEEVSVFYEGEKKEFSLGMLIEITYHTYEAGIRILKEGQCTHEDAIALDFADRRAAKNKVKELLYRFLSEDTGIRLPWGNLTGIRPTKITMGLIESGMSNAKTAEYMRNTYFTGNKKTALSIAIANRERDILKDFDYENGYSLYVGIPFCPSICLYCSFSSYPLQQWESRVDEYLDTLCRELDFISEAMKDKSLDTIYIGGGTPTTLNPLQIKKLLGHLDKKFPVSQVKEYTVEAGRPDSITREKLEAIREYPVTRISVNPQTMNQKTLDLIGRKHTAKQTNIAFQLAREAGFDNINMDLIVGLPGEEREDVIHTLNEIKRLDPDSLTVHSLAIKRAARLNLFKEQYQEMTMENNQEIMDLTMDCALQLGMGPYYLYRQKNIAGNLENTGYAKPGKAGVYNILMMEEKQTIMAAGAGGASKLVFQSQQRIERIENVKDVTNYISRIDEMIERKRAGIAAYL